MTAVDITAATKGVLETKYHVIVDQAEGLDYLPVDHETVGMIAQSLHGADRVSVLRHLPQRPYGNTIIFTGTAEAKLGQFLVLCHLHMARVLEDDVLVRYINAVAAVVGEKSQRYDLTYRVVVLKDESINGYGLPGGYIVLTSGLLRCIRSEAELACVLGHEMAHINLYHGMREFRKRAVHRKAAGYFEELDGLVGKSAKEIEMNYLNDEMYLQYVGGKRGRRDEEEADIYGIAYASAAGYDPDSLVALLLRIKKMKGDTGDRFRHHPSIGDRIECLRKAVDKYAFSSDFQKEFFERFKQEVLEKIEKSAQEDGE